ncbi:MAG: phosphoenolpyruvate carboxylase, partial [Bacteroidota bacterium]
RKEEDAWVGILNDIAAHAYTRYREIVYEDSRFMDYFTEATPVREISLMNIGSRPAKRVESDRLEDLRAIPWVFGWMQSRHVIPGWLGAGTGIRAFLNAEGNAGKKKKQRLALLKTMYNEWPPFRTLLDNIQMIMAKADLGIARHYAGLVKPEEFGETVFQELKLEFELTQEMILLVTGQKAILDHNPTLQRSIQLRNPYVDPMSYIQIEILHRLRADGASEGDRKALEQVAFLSINGIAAGLRNTG